MAEQRTPREQDSRQQEERPTDSWVPPSVLPVPTPQEGWAFRWIRTSFLDKSDGKNVSKKFREGWVPVKAEDHPEMQVMSDLDSRFEGGIEIGGQLLCKMPEEKLNQRREYYESMAGQQMESVDKHYLQENDPRMPLLQSERSTRNTFGKGQ